MSVGELEDWGRNRFGAKYKESGSQNKDKSLDRAIPSYTVKANDRERIEKRTAEETSCETGKLKQLLKLFTGKVVHLMVSYNLLHVSSVFQAPVPNTGNCMYHYIVTSIKVAKINFQIGLLTISILLC